MQAPAKWRDGLLLALGLILIVAPLLLDFVGDARAAWHALLAGALLFTLSAAALHRQRSWEELAVLALGLWLIAAPFVLGFQPGPAGAAHQAIGALVVVDAAWNLVAAWRHPTGAHHA